MAEVAEQAQRRQANQQQNQEQAGSLVEQFGHSMHDAWTLTALWASIQRLSRSRCSTCQRQPIAVIVLRIALDAGRRAPRRRDERTAGQERSARRVPGGTRLATVHARAEDQRTFGAGTVSPSTPYYWVHSGGVPRPPLPAFQAGSIDARRDAGELAEPAMRAGAATPARVHASVASRAAFAYGAAGNPREFAVCRDVAHKELDQSRPRDGDPDWMYYLTPGHVDALAGSALVRLAQTARAQGRRTGLAVDFAIASGCCARVPPFATPSIPTSAVQPSTGAGSRLPTPFTATSIRPVRSGG